MAARAGLLWWSDVGVGLGAPSLSASYFIAKQSCLLKVSCFKSTFTQEIPTDGLILGTAFALILSIASKI